MDYIGDNIRYFLEEQGKTQVELADALNTSRQVVYKIINGKKALRADEFVRIAGFLGIKLETLVKEREISKTEDTLSLQLMGEIKDKETVEYVIELVENLVLMDEELEEYGVKA